MFGSNHAAKVAIFLRLLAPLGICAAWCIAATVACGATPPALVQSASMDAGIATSASLAFPANNTAGNFIAICIRGGVSGESFTVTDSRANVYHPAVQMNVTVDTPLGDTLGIYYAESIAGGSNAVTVSSSASSTIRFAILEYSGIATTNSLDVTAAAQGVSAQPNSGNAVTTSGGDLVLGSVISADPESWTAGGSFSMAQSIPPAPNTKLIAENFVQGTAGTTSAIAFLASSNPWGAGMAAFKPGVGGPPSPIISSLNPSSGTVGTTVTIVGSNFGTTTGTVKFNGTQATIGSWSATSITTQVPNGATSGNVVVTAGGLPSNGVNFNVVLPPAGITLVQAAGIDAGTANPSSLAFTLNNTAGNWIAVCIRGGASGENFTIADSRGNTYRRALQLNVIVDAPLGDTLGIYYAENIAGGPNAVTVSASASATIRFAILEYSGIAATNSLDVTAAAQDVSAQPNSGSAVTTSSGDLVLGAILSADPASWTAGGSFSLAQSIPPAPNTKLIAENWVQGTAGTASAIAFMGNSNPWGAGMAAFRAATAPPPPPPPNPSVTVLPTAASVLIGGNTQAFSASVSNDPSNQGVKWTLTGAGCSGASCGTLLNATPTTVTYSSPSGLPAPASVTLTATSIASSSATAPAAITLTATAPVTVSLSPKRAGITIFQTQQFAATVVNDPNNAGVSWSVDGNLGGNSTTGTVNASGLFTPGTQVGAHVVTAASLADSSKSFSATTGVTDLAGVLTYHNDQARDGSNVKEYALTTVNLTPTTFGKLFSCAADGAIYAQPLWIPNLPIAGGSHNVVLVATEHDSVYAIDADGGSGNSCVQYWKVSLLNGGTPVSSQDAQTNDIFGEIGITGTPVIDIGTKTLYVVSKTKEGSTFHQRLHALNLADGAEKFNGPVDITPAITVSGSADTGDSTVGCTSAANTVPFCPMRENQRSGLALGNGTVYVAWASHGDIQPYHGWIMGFTASDLSQPPTVFNTTPNGIEGGIWMAGGAPAIDSSNNLYVITGNGDWNGTKNYSDSVLKMSSALTVSDWFTPSDQLNLQGNDFDLGSGGAMMLVDLPLSPMPQILIGGGKQGSNQPGELYVLNRDNLGKTNSSDSGVFQKFPAGGRLFATGAFWQNSFYIAGAGSALVVFTVNPSTSTFTTIASSMSPTTFGFPGVTPSISSSGTSNGIVWAIDSSQYGVSDTNFSNPSGPAVLHAYDATNLATELWKSSTGAGNTAGNAVKMTVPTVANGKVYVGTRGNDDTHGSGTIKGELDVYGLLPN